MSICFEGRCSIHLNYGRFFDFARVSPYSFGLTSKTARRGQASRARASGLLGRFRAISVHSTYPVLAQMEAA